MDDKLNNLNFHLIEQLNPYHLHFSFNSDTAELVDVVRWLTDTQSTKNLVSDMRARRLWESCDTAHVLPGPGSDNNFLIIFVGNNIKYLDNL